MDTLSELSDLQLTNLFWACVENKTLMINRNTLAKGKLGTLLYELGMFYHGGKCDISIYKRTTEQMKLVNQTIFPVC